MLALSNHICGSFMNNGSWEINERFATNKEPFGKLYSPMFVAFVVAWIRLVGAILEALWISDIVAMV